MSSCRNCRRCTHLNKIFLCMKFGVEVTPIPNTICEWFEKRKYKMPQMVINHDMLHDNTTMDESEQTPDQSLSDKE